MKKKTTRPRSNAKPKSKSPTMLFFESESFKIMEAYADAHVAQARAWERMKRNNSYQEERWIYTDAQKRTSMARNAILEHVRLFREPKPKVCPTCGHCIECGHRRDCPA